MIYILLNDIIPTIMIEKPLILAVETSGRMGSVAIAEGDLLLAETAFSAPMRHSAEIFQAITDLLTRLGHSPKQINHVYISIGPGSFTGLRIAVTIAKAMHIANNNVKIVAVDTLDVIAANAADHISKKNAPISKIATILDAKRNQFFIAVYQNRNGKLVKILDDGLMTTEQFHEKFTSQAEPISLLGEGLVFYKEQFNAPAVEFLDEALWCPKAEKVHLLGWQMASQNKFADAPTLQPAYLRQAKPEKKRIKPPKPKKTKAQRKRG